MFNYFREVPLFRKVRPLFLVSVATGLILIPVFALGQSQPGEINLEVMTAILQETVPYRFGNDLKVGDYIKYKPSAMLTRSSQGEGIVEIEVTGKEGNGLWISTSYGPEGIDGVTDLLVDIKNMKLLKGWSMDGNGKKMEPPLISDERAAAILDSLIKMGRSQAPQLMGLKVGDGTKEVTVPGGTFDCRYIEPRFDSTMMPNVSQEQIDMFVTQSRHYFSEKVPRLLPIEVMSQMMIDLSALNKVKGGLVKSPLFEIFEYGNKKQ